MWAESLIQKCPATERKCELNILCAARVHLIRTLSKINVSRSIVVHMHTAIPPPRTQRRRHGEQHIQTYTLSKFSRQLPAPFIHRLNRILQGTLYSGVCKVKFEQCVVQLILTFAFPQRPLWVLCRKFQQRL